LASHRQLLDLPARFTLMDQLTNELNSFYNINKLNAEKKIRNKLNTTIQNLKEVQISVITGYKRMIRVKGVGYKFSLNMAQHIITIEVGYSYLLQIRLAAEFSPILHKKSIELEMQSDNLLQLTTFLSKVRKLRTPDVYKGKGIRYKKDPVQRKEGKKKKSF